MITFKFKTAQMERAMEEIIFLSKRSDEFVVKQTTKGTMINLVKFTSLFKFVRNEAWKFLESILEKVAKGRARLGWWPAWKELGVRGTPKIGNGPLRDRGEGGIIDNSKNIINPHITVFNEVPYIEILDRKEKIVNRALNSQQRFMDQFLEREYKKIFRSRSG